MKKFEYIQEVEIWLNRRGGRTIKDIEVDEDGKIYISMMTKDYGTKKVYLPPVDSDVYKDLLMKIYHGAMYR